MKKLLIYRRVQGTEKSELLRSVSVHPGFVGIGANGIINESEFKKLAQDLESSHTSISVINI